MYFKLTLKSTNPKTGPIPVSTTSGESCPDACPLKASKICYAMSGHVSMVWDKVNRGLFVMANWLAFLAAVAKLPLGTLWRHNQAGDLPGEGDTLDCGMVHQLVASNHGRRGFTYTHKPLSTAEERQTIADANQGGFTINLSANNLSHADTLSDLHIGPVVTILDAAIQGNVKVFTPAGRRVVVCPATYRDDIRCLECGLCQIAKRPTIVGFPAHGVQKKAASAIALAA